VIYWIHVRHPEISLVCRYLAQLLTTLKHGAIPYIPSKVNSKGGGNAAYGHSEVWTRMFHFYSLHREEFLQHYHKRSNIVSHDQVEVWSETQKQVTHGAGQAQRLAEEADSSAEASTEIVML